jgi:hypothetical protein
MESFSNVSLYIKRVEMYQSKEFIIDTFSKLSIGKVRDVRFIKKVGPTGIDYNGAVITFVSWSMNSRVKQLFDSMNETLDGTTKLIYNYDTNRYWIVSVYKSQFPEFEEITTINPNLPDKEKIKQLETLVKSMAAQIHYMQLRQEKSERQAMEHENNETKNYMTNLNLKCQLEEQTQDSKWTEEDIIEELRETQGEVEVLRCKLACIGIELARKEEECTDLKNKLSNQTNNDNWQINNSQIEEDYMPNIGAMSIEELR